jgi:AcrR family transcriptional regulator
MSRPRGRPRSFDEGEVLERALQTFWTRGFDATSLDDLTEATGVARPSLFAAFGNKEAIYVRAIDRYGDRMRTTFDASFTEEASLGEALERFFLASIDMYCSGEDGPRGCFGFCTAPAAAVEHPEIRRALAGAIESTDARFEAEFRRAIKRGQLSAAADTQRLGRTASATLHSIAVRARAGADRGELQLIANHAVEDLLREARVRVPTRVSSPQRGASRATK